MTKKKKEFVVKYNLTVLQIYTITADPLKMCCSIWLNLVFKSKSSKQNMHWPTSNKSEFFFFFFKARVRIDIIHS